MPYIFIALELAAVFAVVAGEGFAIHAGAAAMGLPLAVSRGIVALPLLAVAFQYLEFRYGAARWGAMTKLIKVAGGTAFVLFSIIVSARYLQEDSELRAGRAAAAVTSAAEAASLAGSLSRMRDEHAAIKEAARSSDLEDQLRVARETVSRESAPERGGCVQWVKGAGGARQPSKCANAEADVIAIGARITQARAREALEAKIAKAEEKLEAASGVVQPNGAGFQILTYELSPSIRDAILLAILAAAAVAIMAIPNAFSDILKRLEATLRARGAIPAPEAPTEVIWAEFEPVAAPASPPRALPSPDPLKAFVSACLEELPAGEGGLTVSQIRDAWRAWAAASDLPEPCAANAKIGPALKKALGVDNIEAGKAGRNGRRTRFRLSPDWNHLLT